MMPSNVMMRWPAREGGSETRFLSFVGHERDKTRIYELLRENCMHTPASLSLQTKFVAHHCSDDAV